MIAVNGICRIYSQYMEKGEIKVVTQEQAVNPDEFWGDKQRVVEIIGEGSGNGFSIKNANLPMNWEESLDNVKKIGIDRYTQSISEECNLLGYGLKEVIFDTNNILTKLVIAKKDGFESNLELGGDFRECEKAEYTTRNLSKIGAAVLMQSLISEYLSFGWGDENFRYGHIGYSGDDIGSYYPVDLAIPEIINLDEKITNEYYQEVFKNNANNIAGRFGINLRNIDFTKNGLLQYVEVDGVNGCFYNLEDTYTGRPNRRYYCHNVDSASQASALHGIVASYINFLLDKNSRS